MRGKRVWGAEERAREGRVCNIIGMKGNCIETVFGWAPLTHKDKCPPESVEALMPGAQREGGAL